MKDMTATQFGAALVPRAPAELLCTAAALIGNANDYHLGTVDYDTHGRRNRMLWDSVHRSDHDALAMLLKRGVRS